MSRSIRASLFLMVAPFAITFTLAAWVVESKVGPWLDQPLMTDCGGRGFPAWFCALQDSLFTWVALGLGVLVLLSVTALLSIALFRAGIRDLQQNVMEFQKGQRGHLATDVPREVSPLVQLLNRILQSSMSSQAGGTPSHGGRVSASPDAGYRPAGTPPDRRPGASGPPTPPQHRPGPARPREARVTENPPHPMEVSPEPATTPSSGDLEVSLQELNEKLDRALKETPEPVPEPEPEPEPEREREREREKSVPRAPAESRRSAPTDRHSGNTGNRQTDAGSGHGAKKNQAFPARKCRKLIAILGHRYPDVNFELITDVTEDTPWTIREAELTEVFGELLDNAGKWAKSQVNIFLAIKGNMLVFGVADDGPGVDPELTVHLGEENFRVSPEQPPGRGLPAVRRVIDTHGGSLAFDRSRLGGLEAIAALPGSPVPRHTGAPGLYH